jgi:DNA anti-recombination protein RmuC
MISLFRNGSVTVASVAQQALTKIDQHMHDCELRGEKTDRRMDQQDNSAREMHAENTRRLDDTNRRLNQIESTSRNRYLVLVTTMLFTVVGVAFELFVKK